MVEPGIVDVAALLDRAARGDRRAFGDFVDATAASALLLLRVMGHPDGAEMLPTSYVDAWCHLDEYTSGDLSPRAWLLARLHTSARREVEARPDGGR